MSRRITDEDIMLVCWPSVGPQDIKHTYILTYMLAASLGTDSRSEQLHVQL